MGDQAHHLQLLVVDHCLEAHQLTQRIGISGEDEDPAVRDVLGPEVRLAGGGLNLDVEGDVDAGILTVFTFVHAGLPVLRSCANSIERSDRCCHAGPGDNRRVGDLVIW